MFHYTYFDIRLESNLALPELPVGQKAVPGRAGWRFDLLKKPLTIETTKPYHRWQLADGDPWVSFSRGEHGYLLDFLDAAGFWINPSARLIQGYSRPNLTIDQMRHLLIDLVLPLTWSLEERPVFHGSCLKVGTGAIGFLGASGQGKSTIAAALARMGFGLLTDDCFLLEPGESHAFRVVANYPGLRLRIDAARALMGDHLNDYSEGEDETWKIRWGPAFNRISNPAVQPNLIALFVLDRKEGCAPGLSIGKVVPGQALPAILPHVFKLDWKAKGIHAHQFEILCDMILSVPVYSLGYQMDRNLALTWLPKLVSFWQEQGWL